MLNSLLHKDKDVDISWNFVLLLSCRFADFFGGRGFDHDAVFFSDLAL